MRILDYSCSSFDSCIIVVCWYCMDIVMDI